MCVKLLVWLILNIWVQTTLINARLTKSVQTTGARERRKMNQVDESGLAHIHQAAKKGYFSSVEKFLKASNDQLEFETQDDLHDTPLLVAVRTGMQNIDTINIIIEFGVRNCNLVQISVAILKLPIARTTELLRSAVWRATRTSSSTLTTLTGRSGLFGADSSSSALLSWTMRQKVRGVQSAPSHIKSTMKLVPNGRICWIIMEWYICEGYKKQYWRGSKSGDIEVFNKYPRSD
ncbi:hypothetical protein EB796_006980 [Bugula neritina]|uniref:ANKFY1 n=1 Tax=Bugula neritina TaxID=10212 RepID=A0A7J7KA34_BUGNE|nr:hypothetical protein EB796_006980 [Bugula neritina]